MGGWGRMLCHVLVTQLAVFRCTEVNQWVASWLFFLHSFGLRPCTVHTPLSCGLSINDHNLPNSCRNTGNIMTKARNRTSPQSLKKLIIVKMNDECCGRTVTSEHHNASVSNASANTSRQILKTLPSSCPSKDLCFLVYLCHV